MRWLAPWRDMLNVVEWARYASDVLLLAPAARVLPLRLSLALAHALGVCDALLPTRAGRATRAEAAARGVDGAWGRFRASATRLAFPRKDFVYLVRFASGRDALADWTIEEVGAAEIKQLLAEGRSVVLAAGHFSSTGSRLRRAILRRRSMSLVGEPVPWQLSPFRLRLRHSTGLRARASARAFEALPAEVNASRREHVPDRWTRGVDLNTTPRRSSHIQEAMLAHLAEPGALLVVAVDAAWPKEGALRRPFAGRLDQPFAVGAARAARLAQSPIVPYAVALGSTPHTARIEFGSPIEPPARDDTAGDARVTNQLLDWLEVRIGRHPEQFLGHIGWDRSWDPGAERWNGPAVAVDERRAATADAAS